MNRTVLVIGIIFLLIGVSVVSSTENISKISSMYKSNNSSPYTPSNYYPCGEIEIPLVVNLSWDGGDPDPGDTVTYDVYLDDVKIATVGPYPWNQTRIEYGPVELEYSTTYYMMIGAWDNHGAYVVGYICSFTTGDNHPPNEPGWENPTNGSTDISICPLNLSWICSDPDGDNVTFDVYFGSTNPPPLVASNVSGYTTGILGFNTTYYWKIVAWDEHGASTPGPIWHFTTEPNYPPNPAEDPYPPDGDCCVPVEGVILKWNGSDPNLCDEFRYDLYFDDVNPPLTQVLAESFQNFYGIPFTLPKYKTFYWRVDTYDKTGEFKEGYVWSFTTGDNWSSPTKPIIDGPTHGKVGVEYTYTFNSTDYKGDYCVCIVNWGDGSPSETVPPAGGPNGSGPGIASHSWDAKGPYTIKARGMDDYGNYGDWGNLTVTIPRDKYKDNILLLRILERFPLLQKLIQQLRVGL